MKREIKFRAWTGNCMMFKVLDDRNWYDSIKTEAKPIMKQSTSDCYKYEVMQYTGLKDKNKKEIYEEDIIKDCISNNKFIVTFGEYKLKPFSKNDLQLKHLGWYLKPIFNYDSKHEVEWNGEILSLAELTNIEVIGNVYENKELFMKIRSY